MKTYKIGISEEVSGYITISAKNKKEAIKSVDNTLSELGIVGFPDFDVEYRDCSIINKPEEI